MSLVPADSRVGEFAASIAHEVSQPLAAIAVNAECCLQWLAQAEPDLELARRAAERIVRNSRLASDVIRSVRSLYCGSHCETSPLAIGEVITEVLESMKADFALNEVVLETSLVAEPVRVIGDRTQLQQVLSNLVRNAIEAMRESPRPRRLEVTTSLEGYVLSITVSDTGIGLDDAMIERIFEPFFTTKRNGMGLGLAISRSIVSAHGGTLRAMRRAPGGSSFSIKLPATRCVR